MHRKLNANSKRYEQALRLARNFMIGQSMEGKVIYPIFFKYFMQYCGGLGFIIVMVMGIGESLHNALFGVVTTFTATGYSTMNYAGWPPFAVGLLILLMIIGGCAGSTAGGIKLSRTYLLIRITRENICKRLSSARELLST